MIRIIFRDEDGSIRMDGTPAELPQLLQANNSMLWVDMLTPDPAEQRTILEDTFHFHPLAVEDAIADAHLPKLDDYGSYLYLVFHTVALGVEPMDIRTEEIDVFLGASYLITMHDAPRRSIERCWNPEYHLVHGLARGPAMLLYELLDAQIDNYIPIIDAFESQLEKLGDDIFLSAEKEPVILNKLLTAKTSSLRLQRILAPQRELLGRLSASEYAVIPKQVRIYFRDVYDHLARLTNLAESTRDLAGSTIETHLALVNNRMNEVMKLLTIISTIFIPLSFLAGVYGMNFEYMPELEQAVGLSTDLAGLYHSWCEHAFVFQTTQVDLTRMEVTEELKQSWQRQRFDHSAGGVAYRWSEEGGIEIALIATRQGTRWQLPKGACEAGETPIYTAVREVREEVGLDTMAETFVHTIEYWYWDTYRKVTPELVHKQVDFYLLRVVGGELSDASIEIDSAAWFTATQALAVLTFPGEQQTLRLAIERLERAQR